MCVCACMSAKGWSIMFSRALKLYPKGAAGKWLSFYLYLDDNETLTTDEKIYARAHLRVIDPQGSNHITDTSMS